MLRSTLFTALALSVAAPAIAGDYVGLDNGTGDLYSIDTGTNSSTLLGPIQGGPPFGFANIDRGTDGFLYGCAPGLINGYTIYRIDPNSLQATALHTIATDTPGQVGFAIDPSATKAWVAGFKGFSLLVKVQEVDLLTGTMTERGVNAGNWWGLAFDAAGQLYTSTQGAVDPELIRVNMTDAALSTLVGPMTNVDFQLGLDLASDIGLGSIAVISRNSDLLYSVDTNTGAATLLGGTGAVGASVFSIASDDPCAGSATSYGAGCPGSLGFVPKLKVTGCPVVGDVMNINITEGLGGSTAILFFGLGQGATPVGAGCTFLLAPVLPASISLPLGGGAGNPGAGSLSFGTVVPASLSGITFTTQAWVLDSAVLIGAAGSNAVKVTVP